MNDTKNNEIIELTLPINAAYVSSARLTGSSIANRMGFDIDEIEDIKAAVSEACTYIIKQYSSSTKNSFKIMFHLTDETLKITMILESSIKSSGTGDDMGLLMIKALMDELNINFDKDNTLNIVMLKEHKRNSFIE